MRHGSAWFDRSKINFVSPTDKLCYLNSVKKTFSLPLGNLIILVLASTPTIFEFLLQKFALPRHSVRITGKKLVACVSWLQPSLFRDLSLGGPFSWTPVGSAKDPPLGKLAFHPHKAVLLDPFNVRPEFETANSGNQQKIGPQFPSAYVWLLK